MTVAERIACWYAGRLSTEHEDFLLPPGGAGVIVRVTHGATGTRLANGSQATTREVSVLTKVFPNAKVFFSTYSGNPPGAREEFWTKEVLPDATHVGAIPTTSAEAIALQQCCGTAGTIPLWIIIVTDWFNGPRTEDIYQIFFPKTQIFVAALPIAVTFDPESPIVNFRDMNRAILWETLIPMVPFWVMTHTGSLGKRLLVWLSNRICQTAATPTAAMTERKEHATPILIAVAGALACLVAYLLTK